MDHLRLNSRDQNDATDYGFLKSYKSFFGEYFLNESLIFACDT